MDMDHTSSRFSEMETSHLCVTAPVRPPISLQAPDTRQGHARLPTSRYAYHDKQFF
jgi:hypothetical protein